MLWRSLTCPASVQGDAVREAKARKAEKEVIDKEVEKLLELKNLLSLSQGIDPTETKKRKEKGKK